MKRILYFSACAASVLMTGVALASCNKDDVLESDPGDTPGGNTPAESFEGVRVYEWIPAPGQFINEFIDASGEFQIIDTKEAANEWAETRIKNNQYVSLGSFGGYIVMGLDHSIMAGNADYDFYVSGNAFLSSNGGSNEPGIVWVMQDTNGNHLPDDKWYELAGSEASDPATQRGFSVTYFRPNGPKQNVDWRASDGRTGIVKYLAPIHKQDYYYPAWVDEDEYTLTGTLLSSKNSENPKTGYWNNAAYAWGYADNIGSDNLTPNATASSGQRTGFRIANAVNADGTKIKLDYIDFVKVQTGVLANSGPLGEISTEVCGFGEYPF